MSRLMFWLGSLMFTKEKKMMKMNDKGAPVAFMHRMHESPPGF